MASRYEVHRDTLKTKRNVGSDISELKTLYSQTPKFYSKMDFDEFLSYANEGATNELDKSVSDYREQSKVRKTDPLIADPDYYKKLFSVTDKDYEDTAEKQGFKGLRRTAASILSESTSSMLNLMHNVNPLNNKTKKLLDSKLKESSGEVVPTERDIEKRIERGVNKFIRKPFGSSKFGYTDLFETKYDEKTGEEYYEVKPPESTAESLARPLGELMYGFQALKLGKVDKGVGKVVEKLKERVKLSPRGRGRPSQARLAAESNELFKTRLINSGATIAKTELASQFAFADDPEFNIVASKLAEHFGDDDNAMADLLNYLDTDDESPETARRLSLLLDGIFISGAVSTFLGAAKVTVKGATNLINEIKASGPEGVDAFKKVINDGRKSDKAAKIIAKPEPDLDIITDWTNKIFQNNALGRKLNEGQKQLQRGWYNLRRSSGMMTPEMFKIIKSGEYDRIGWSQRAMDLHANLMVTMRKAAKDSKVKFEDIEEDFGHFMVGSLKNGKRIKIKDLPENIRPYAQEARTTIDSLSKLLLQSKHIPKETRKEIEKNMGTYLRKTYDAFENPNWTATAEMIAKATSEIKASIKAADIAKGMKRLRSDAYYQQEAEVTINKWINKDDFKSMENHINKVFGSKKAETLFKARVTLRPAIEELLGGKNVSTTTAVFRTIETLAHQQSKYKMFDDLAEKGLGKWFWRGTGKNSTAPDSRMTLGKITGQQFGNLNGAKTTPEIARLFNNMGKVDQMEWGRYIYGSFLRAKGFGQAAATVYNLTTHVRNTVGGGIIVMRNGFNPFTSELGDSFEILSNQLNRAGAKKNDTLSEIYREYQKLGLVNQNVKVGDFKALINDITQTGKNTFNDRGTNILQKIASGASRTNKGLTDLYVAEDDLWRILVYNKELKVLQRANTLVPVASQKSLAVLKQEASDIVRNTMPTYDLIAPTLLGIRKLPIGNFFSFTAEQWRNNYHTLLRGVDEVASGNEALVERGMQRLAGQMTVTYAGYKGLTDTSKYFFGVSDEEEQAVRDLDLADWSQNSAIVFDRTKEGFLEYTDLTYTDPSAPVTDVFRAFIGEVTEGRNPKDTKEKIGAGIMKAAKSFIKPFVDPSIVSAALLDVLFQGKDFETGKYLDGYNIQKGTYHPDNLGVVLAHVGKELIPREIKDDYSLFLGKKAERIKKGEISMENELFSRVTGQRTQILTPDRLARNFGFKITELNTQVKLAKDNLNTYVYDDTMTPNKLLAEYQDGVSAYYPSFVKAKLAFEAAVTLGLEKNSVMKISNKRLRSFNSAESSEFNSFNNAFTPIRLTQSQLTFFKLNGDFTDMSYAQFLKEYNDIYSEFSHLPIIRESDYGWANPDLAKSRGRYDPSQPKPSKFEYSTGGLVEGEDTVPYTKEDPADRVNPYTGEPYQEQMDRLGFSNGMGEPENLIAKSIAQLANEKRYNFDYEQNFDKETGKRIENIYVNKGDTRGKFVRDVYLNAKSRGLAYPEIVASQAAAESRYGASKIAQEANNLFGIKLREGETGEAREFMTKEDYGQGQVPEKANFRVFNSVDESVQGYNTFIKDKKYNEALQAKTPLEYLQKIKDAGYATDQSYVKTVGDVYQQYKNAGIFD